MTGVLQPLQYGFSLLLPRDRLATNDGARLVAMSRQALESLSAEQRSLLEANGKVIAAPIDNIEASAGGSVRCMLAEVHLPKD